MGELCPPYHHHHPPNSYIGVLTRIVSPNVTVFEDRDLKEVIKVK